MVLVISCNVLFFFYCGEIYIKLSILTIFKCTVHNVYFKMSSLCKIKIKNWSSYIVPQSGFVCVCVCEILLVCEM